MARKPVADSLLLSGAGSLVSGLAFLSAAYPMVRRAGSGPSRSANIAHAIWWAGLGAYLVLQAGMTMLASRGQLTADIYLGSRLVAIPLLCAAVWGLCSYFAYLLTGKRRTSLYFLALYVAVMVVFFATTFIDPPALVIGEWLVGYDASSPLVALVYVLVGLPPILACVAYIALLRRVHDAHQRYRILLLGTSILAYVGSGLVARLTSHDLVIFLSLVPLGVLAAIAVLLANFPPGGVRDRLDAINSRPRPATDVTALQQRMRDLV